MWEKALETPGEVLQAEDVVPDTLLRTLLCFSHVLVCLMQYFIRDESFEQGVDDVRPGVGLLRVRELQVGGHLHSVRGLSIIREEGT